jgi:hypothetical protein
MTIDQRIDVLTKNLERICRIIDRPPDAAPVGTPRLPASNGVRQRSMVAQRILEERARARLVLQG